MIVRLATDDEHRVAEGGQSPDLALCIDTITTERPRAKLQSKEDYPELTRGPERHNGNQDRTSQRLSHRVWVPAM